MWIKEWRIEGRKQGSKEGKLSLDKVPLFRIFIVVEITLPLKFPWSLHCWDLGSWIPVIKKANRKNNHIWNRLHNFLRVLLYNSLFELISCRFSSNFSIFTDNNYVYQNNRFMTLVISPIFILYSSHLRWSMPTGRSKIFRWKMI